MMIRIDERCCQELIERSKKECKLKNIITENVKQGLEETTVRVLIEMLKQNF